MERFLDMHMYITSALQKTDMKAVGLQLALDLLHKKVNITFLPIATAKLLFIFLCIFFKKLLILYLFVRREYNNIEYDLVV